MLKEFYSNKTDKELKSMLNLYSGLLISSIVLPIIFTTFHYFLAPYTSGQTNYYNMTKTVKPDRTKSVHPKINEVKVLTQIVYRETTDNKILKIISKPNHSIGAEVFIDNLSAPDGIYIYKSRTHKLIIENGKIKERYYLKNYKNFYIEQKFENIASNGDKVYSLDSLQIEDGKYSLGFALGKIITENGLITNL